MKHIKKIICFVFVFAVLSNVFVLASQASAQDYHYYIEDDGVVLTMYNGSGKEVVVPSKIEGTTVVRLEGTFYGNKTIERITLPEGITVVGGYTFYDCVNLKSIVLPDSLERIASYAFAYSGLPEMVLPVNAHYIEEYAFLGCKNLVAIESKADPIIEDGYALFIGQHAFEDSKIRAIKTEHTPRYYENSFTGDCYFTDSSFRYALYKSDFLYTIIEPFKNFSPLEGMLVLAVCVFVVWLLGYVVVRGVLTLFGADKLKNYKSYCKQVFDDMSTTGDDKQEILYKPIPFLGDQVRRFACKIAIWIAVAAYVAFLFFFFTITTYAWEINSFVKAVIGVLSGVIVSALIVILIVWVNYKIQSTISAHKEADMARSRVRKINGGENDG